jgi:hypothetical protein
MQLSGGGGVVTPEAADSEAWVCVAWWGWRDPE